MRSILKDMMAIAVKRSIYGESVVEADSIGGQPRVEVQLIDDHCAQATLHCVDCFAVIDKATASDPAAAADTLHRRQERRDYRLKHCADCAEHIGGLEHLSLVEEAPNVALAYVEAHDGILTSGRVR